MQGVDLDRSALADWVGHVAHELRPVFEAVMADLKRSTKLFMDETRAPVLDPGAHEVKAGHFWTLALDDRPWSSEARPGVNFTYAPGRGGQHAERILQGFSGILQVWTAMLATTGSLRPTAVAPASSWPMARRKLVEITRTGSAPVADEGVSLLRELYRIEVGSRGLVATARFAVRPERSVPIVTQLNERHIHQRARASAESPLGKALAYIAKY